MSEPWQRPLIDACKRSIAAMLNELDEADDLDLWEEVDGKLTDVLIVYRRSQSSLPPKLARVQYVCGCEADGDVIASSCPVHSAPIRQDHVELRPFMLAPSCPRQGRVQLTPGQLAEMAFCHAVADFADEIRDEMLD